MNTTLDHLVPGLMRIAQERHSAAPNFDLTLQQDEIWRASIYMFGTDLIYGAEGRTVPQVLSDLAVAVVLGRSEMTKG